MNKRDLLVRIKHNVLHIFPNAEIILYGSRARGSANCHSDWDFLILLDKKNISLEDEIKIISSVYDVELEFGEVISTLIYSKSDWKNKLVITPLYKNIKKEGQRIT